MHLKRDPDSDRSSFASGKDPFPEAIFRKQIIVSGICSGSLPAAVGHAL